MNRDKIVEKLNEWAKKELGSLYSVVNDDDDLTLLANGYYVAWFMDFEKGEFIFESHNDLSVELIKKDIIKKFYEKGVELLTKSEPKYTVKVLPSEYGFLYKLKNDLSYLTTSDVGNDCTFNLQWGYFTQSEIDELKQRDDLAVNWDKAIIKEVE